MSIYMTCFHSNSDFDRAAGEMHRNILIHSVQMEIMKYAIIKDGRLAKFMEMAQARDNIFTGEN